MARWYAPSKGGYSAKGPAPATPPKPPKNYTTANKRDGVCSCGHVDGHGALGSTTYEDATANPSSQAF